MVWNQDLRQTILEAARRGEAEHRSGAATAGSGSGNLAWYFPDALYLLVPCLLTFVAFGISAVEHFIQAPKSGFRTDVHLRAIYVRIVMAFPVFAVLALLSAYWPWITVWMEFVIEFIEGYMLFIFFIAACAVGARELAPHGRSVPDVLLASKWTKSRFPMCTGCTADFKDGKSALNFFTFLNLQAIVVRPLCALGVALYVAITDTYDEAPPKYVELPFQIVKALSAIVATIAIVRVGLAIRNDPSEPLEGHRGSLKLATIKLFVLVIVFNNVVLKPLINAQKIAVDSWLCTPSVIADNDFYCELRLMSVVFLCEACVITLPIVLSFGGRGIKGSKPEKPTFSPRRYFVYRIFTLIDVFYLWRCELFAQESNDPSPADSSLSLDHEDDEERKELMERVRGIV